MKEWGILILFFSELPHYFGKWGFWNFSEEEGRYHGLLPH
jgi:hypothetical protein